MVAFDTYKQEWASCHPLAKLFGYIPSGLISCRRFVYEQQGPQLDNVRCVRTLPNLLTRYCHPINLEPRICKNAVWCKCDVDVFQGSVLGCKCCAGCVVEQIACRKRTVSYLFCNTLNCIFDNETALSKMISLSVLPIKICYSWYVVIVIT